MIGEPQEELFPDLAAKSNLLAARFGAPPFTVLDTTQGYWTDRREIWNRLGLRGVEGRGENLLAINPELSKGGTWKAESSSIFDPVLSELMYKWFSPKGGQILDPFAGGATRGVVAALLGLEYHGIDLSEQQVVSNYHQWREIIERVGADSPITPPLWLCGDSIPTLNDWLGWYDFVFSCPPYFDLEKYSEDARDLSNASDYALFLSAYRMIIRLSLACLRPNRFAAFVVGDIRDETGFYRGFVNDTIKAFEDYGAPLYNEAILINSPGTLPVRVGRFFPKHRKLGKRHQNVLIFYKGDVKRIYDELGEAGAVEET